MPTFKEIADALEQAKLTNQMLVYEERALKVHIPVEEEGGLGYHQPYRLIDDQWYILNFSNDQWEDVTNPVVEQQLNEIAKQFYQGSPEPLQGEARE